MNEKLTGKCLRPVEYICGKNLVEDTGEKINYLERKRHIIFWEMFRNGQPDCDDDQLLFVAMTALQPRNKDSLKIPKG
jgi:hypothetical protein